MNYNEFKNMEDLIMLPNRRFQQNWLPAFFNDFFEDGFGRFGNTNSPAINVIENEKEYKVEIAAPGMAKEDFKIRINEDNQLVVSMEHKFDSDEDKGRSKDEKYLRREFSYSQFEQTLLLPDDIKKDKISAKMHHGVLKITLPKITEVPAAPKETLIDIQ